MKSLDQHQAGVKKIAKEIKEYYLSNKTKKLRFYHGGTNSTRKQINKDFSWINISKLNSVIEINVKEKYIFVEPNVSMENLVSLTLEYGLVPTSVPEFRAITVGGAVQGAAGESSAFKYGLFDNYCLEYEIVLGNGDLIKTSPQYRSDLFWGVPGTYGSLGLITLVKLKLVPAKKFVLLNYHVVKSFKEAESFMEEECKNKIDFIDGIMFSENKGSIMTGTLVNRSEIPITKISGVLEDWFYLRTKVISNKHDDWKELIPIKDYLFRYDRGSFWMSRYGFSLLRIPFNRITRFFSNPFVTTKNAYRILHRLNLTQKYIVQDICLPKDNVLEFLKYVNRELNIYPLWFLPIKPSRRNSFLPNFLKTDLVMDVGVWGKYITNLSYGYTLNRDLEKIVEKLYGRKIFYANTYYSEEEFWKIYDKRLYQNLRKKYFAEKTFPDIWQKIHSKK